MRNAVDEYYAVLPVHD